MAHLSFQIIEGLEAGQVYENLKTPLTIGREEDNDIQLNDERISRFHAKVQSDGGKLILTDLDSTNGTRVNGHPVKMRVLRAGDLIMVGRCVLVMGTDEHPFQGPQHQSSLVDSDPDQSVSSGGDLTDQEAAFPQGPPPAPESLTALQVAEVSDMLEFIRTEILRTLCTPSDSVPADENLLRIHRSAWERLEQLAPQISRYITQLTDPEVK